jgi:hypothetical protein
MRLFPTVSPANTLVRWGGTQRLRLPSAGSTIPHLRPTGSSSGSLPSITTRWSSSSPSDSTSRWTPCPPKRSYGWLQVRLGCVPLSPSCPFRLLHTFARLRPVRHYPHLRISTRGPGSSGTSTHLRRVLPGTHYGLCGLLAPWESPRRPFRRKASSPQVRTLYIKLTVLLFPKKKPPAKR